MSDVGLEKELLESRKQTVHRHTSWSLKLPSKGGAHNNIAMITTDILTYHGTPFQRLVPLAQGEGWHDAQHHTYQVIW